MYSSEQTAARLLETSETVTSRRLQAVLDIHQLSEGELRGKRVLDLGCGRSNLQAELNARNIGATVIGIDRTDVAIWGTRPVHDDSRRFVQAELSALPIRDETVDVALATYSLPFWAKSMAEIEQFYRECARVVKPGGLISLAPMAIAVEYRTEIQDLTHSSSPYTGTQQIFPQDQWKVLFRKNATYAAMKR